MKRWIACLLIVTMLAAIWSCSSPRGVHLGDVRSEERAAMEGTGCPVAGYTTSDAQHHPFKGNLFLRGDSLMFVRELKRAHAGAPSAEVHLARADVASVDLSRNDPVKTVLAVIGITALVLGILVVIALATKESCPFIYSFDGHQYIFDGEPYGGATMKGLERTDFSELEHLVAVDGQYRLRLTNEVDETQHTNSLALLVVDHPKGTRVVCDRDGHPHAFASWGPLRAAQDENGKDLRAWLSDDDRASWYPDLRRLAGDSDSTLTRNHIVLEFDRPPNAGPVWLVTNVATGQWGSHMIRTMLRMRGTQVQDFYAAINGSDLFRNQLMAWNDREELFHLYFEVETRDGWQRQDFIPGGGPFISERRAIPVDLRRVEGNRVRIRMHPPIGFWSLNAFHLAWNERDARSATIEPKSAKAAAGDDALRSLSDDDERYLDFPGNQDWAEIVFDAPPGQRGLERAVFARTRGWYEIHLHDLGDADIAGLARLQNEPGYIVRRALAEYRNFQRTGVLLGTAGAH
jgi:hypothetical protein